MSDIFVTRQPVFDRADAAVAYELRYRPSHDGVDPFMASCLNGAFELLRASLPAWVRATREQLLSGVFATAEASMVTVLVPPDAGEDQDTIDAVARLAAHGVTVGLDEFTFPDDVEAPTHRLLSSAMMVRVDLRCQAPAALAPMVKRLKGMGKKVVADHVSDAGMYQACLAAGFDAFLGSHFSRPEPLPLAALPASTATALRLLALARNPDTPERELESTIGADPGITYQILRIVNSAALGGHGITSIPHALRLIGRTNLVRWLALASTTSRTGSSGVSDELVRQAVHRARFCETLAVPFNGLDKSTLFLTGLFSLLDALFRIPMSEILDRINLSDDVRDALLERSGSYADPLILVESYELGLWQGAATAAERLGFDPRRLATCYGDALQWAEEQMPAGRHRQLARAS
ncbi:MAG: EAL and HDOD domain-containing protein [Gemmatimonadaceae bacterium]